MNDESKDILCQNLLTSLGSLKTALTVDAGISTFDVAVNADSAEAFNELRRLERSLQQYTEKSGGLMYIGFVGHFSAGKSSTINSLLNGSIQGEARITGLHPTDKAVTLITHNDNSASLIGAHKRGEVEVGSSLHESDLLKDVVVVDTPGSGDPLVVEEMVRDFLPICDRVVYTLSAAIPLDSTDLPILKKVHGDLPFLPVRFVVTRADEFKVDRNKEMDSGNVDQSRIDTFVGELISRIAASVPGLNVAQEDVLLVDNISGFNIEELEKFVLPTPAGDELSASQLHSHKVDYYQRSARKVREFFVRYAKQKCSALESLISTATTTREHFYDAVTMANSRLTESWQAQQVSLASKKKGNTDWVTNLASVELSNTLAQTEPLNQQISSAKDAAALWSETSANAIVRSVSERIIAAFDAYLTTLREAVSRTNNPETFELSPFIVDESLLTTNDNCRTPIAVVDSLRGLPAGANDIITRALNKIIEGSDRIREAIREKRVTRRLFESLQESITQLEEMVATFFKSVQLYRSGVLAMNARELAERAGIGRAIDELERTDVADDKKEAWAKRTVDEIFSNRHAIARDTESEFDELDERLRVLVTDCRACLSALRLIPQNDARIIISEEFQVSESQCENKAKELLNGLLSSFNEFSSHRFQQLRTEREQLLEARRIRHATRLQAIRRKRTKRLALFALIGLAVGLIGYGGFYFWQQPFANNWTAAIGVGILANLVTTCFLWGVGWLTDNSKDSEEAANLENIGDTQNIIVDLLRGEGNVDRQSFVKDPVPKQIQMMIQSSWNEAIGRVVNRLVTNANEEQFAHLLKHDVEFSACREEYVRITTECAAKLSEYYARTDENLEVLGKLSADIREEVIVPSFSMFENRNTELREQLEQVGNIEFA